MRLLDAMERQAVETAASSASRWLTWGDRPLHVAKDVEMLAEAAALLDAKLAAIQALRVAVLGGAPVKVDPHELAPVPR